MTWHYSTALHKIRCPVGFGGLKKIPNFSRLSLAICHAWWILQRYLKLLSVEMPRNAINGQSDL
jgi:hypothetical protein